MERGSLALLLLPPPPSILSSTNTRAAYGPAIDAVLNHVSLTEKTRLDIAIAVPSSWLVTSDMSRTALFERTQKALALTYSLIGVIATSQQKELDGLYSLDVRAFFLLPARESAREVEGEGDDDKAFSGPVVDLATLVGSQRAYGTLFGVESEEGERLLKSFLLLYRSKHRHDPTCRRLPGGLFFHKHSPTSAIAAPWGRPHTSIAVGGTFDHLHIGHKLLLTATALLAEPRGSRRNSTQTVLLTIGISGDDLLTHKKFAEEMECWDERQQKVADFLESVIVFSSPRNLSRKVESVSKPGPNGRYVRAMFDSSITINYVQILDPYGPTITDENISALVLSHETRSGGKAINEKRLEKGWRPLEVFEIGVLDVSRSGDDQKDSDTATAAFESKISSTEIRRRIHEKRHSEQ